MSLDSSEWDDLTLNDFVVLAEISRSSGGAVYKAKRKSTGQVVALKERRCAEIGKYHDILHEVMLLSRLRHPNIVQYFGHFFHGHQRHLFIILEFARFGDLHSLLTSIAAGALDDDHDSAPPSRSSREGSSSSSSSSQQHRQQSSRHAQRRHLPEPLVWHIYAQVAAGLSYLHSMHIAHRDIKALNVLLCAAPALSGDDAAAAANSSSSHCAPAVLQYHHSSDASRENIHGTEDDNGDDDDDDDDGDTIVPPQIGGGGGHSKPAAVAAAFALALSSKAARKPNPRRQTRAWLLAGHKWVVKIADLGIGRKIHHEQQLINTFYGTPLYLSPEMCKKEPYTLATDVWSLGVVLYELCALSPPFHGGNIIELSRAICTCAAPPLPPPFNASAPLRRLLGGLLAKHPSHRPPVADALAFVAREAVPYLKQFAAAAERARMGSDAGQY